MAVTLHRATGHWSKPMTAEQLDGWAIESRGYQTQRRDDPWAPVESSRRDATA